MACYVGHVVLLFAVVGHILAMNTCSEKVGNTFLENENLDGSYLEDLAGISYWAGLGDEPDKIGNTTILINFSKLASNARSEKYSTVTITKTFNDMSPDKFNAVWTQKGDDRFFTAEYPDGQYNIYHFYYKGLIVFHRCTVKSIKDGNVFFLVFAPIGRTKAQVKPLLQELEVVLSRKFPKENTIYLEYPVINFTTKV